MQATLLFVFVFAASTLALALPRPQESELPRCRSQLNYLLCLETCVLPGTVECPDRCCECCVDIPNGVCGLTVCVCGSCDCVYWHYRALDWGGEGGDWGIWV